MTRAVVEGVEGEGVDERPRVTPIWLSLAHPARMSLSLPLVAVSLTKGRSGQAATFQSMVTGILRGRGGKGERMEDCECVDFLCAIFWRLLGTAMGEQIVI